MADRSNSTWKNKKSNNQRKKQKRSRNNFKRSKTVACRSELLGKSNVPHDKIRTCDLPESVDSNAESNIESVIPTDEESMNIESTTERHKDCGENVSEAYSIQKEATKRSRRSSSLSIEAISINDEPPDTTDNLSPQEELYLRNFLEVINLVNSPKNVLTVSTVDSMREEKTKKRNALLNYFSPLVQKPRYLDIIAEECSDELSDREKCRLDYHLKQGTPEPDCPPESSSLFNPRIRRKPVNQLPYNRLAEETLLVRAKLLETPYLIEHTSASENAEPEKVYLESSSDTTTSDSEISEETGMEYLINDGEFQNGTFNEDTKMNKESKLRPETFDTVEYRESFDLQNGNVGNKVETTNKSSNSGIFEETCTDADGEVQSKTCSEINLRNEELWLKPETSDRVEFRGSSDIQDEKVEIGTNATTNFEEFLTLDPGKYALKEKIDTSFHAPSQNHSFFNELTSPPKPETSNKTSFTADTIDIEDDMREISVNTAKILSSVLNELYQSTNEVIQYHQPISDYDETGSHNIDSSSASAESSTRKSPSTTRLNPMNISVADATSILPDLEFAEKALTFEQPNSLRKICFNFLLSLSCDADNLQELSDISFNLDKLTQAIELTKPIIDDNNSTESNELCISELSTKMRFEKCTSLPISEHQNITLFVSPSQKNHLKKSDYIRNEPDILFDLHTKFIARQEPDKTAKSSQNFSENNVGRRTYRSTLSENCYLTLPTYFKQNPRLNVSNLSDWLKIARSDEESRTMKQILFSDDIYEQEMKYILRKEKSIEKELEALLLEKMRLSGQEGQRELQPKKILVRSKIDVKNESYRPQSFPPSISEKFRREMYDEYMSRITDREERKQLKVLKITSFPEKKIGKRNPPNLEVSHPTGIEDEFMKKVQELRGTLDAVENDATQENRINDLEAILIMDGDALREVKEYPKHLKEFLEMSSDAGSTTSPADCATGVWSPGQKQELISNEIQNHHRIDEEDASIPSVWQPKSAASSPLTGKKEFRAVNFESSTIVRKNKSEEVLNDSARLTSKPCQAPRGDDVRNSHFSTIDIRLPTSHSSPAIGFNDYKYSPLPRPQNPTVTLLQKAREEQLKGVSNYLEASRDPHRIPQATFRQEGIVNAKKNEQVSGENSQRIIDLSRGKIEAVESSNGMPSTLRSEIRDSNQSKWYKKMYDTIHKQKPYKDEYVTVRYKQKRPQYAQVTGYLSEPEQGAYENDQMEYKYATLDRRRMPLNEKENFLSSTLPRNVSLKTSTSSDGIYNIPDARTNPGRIENYTPGHSSISNQESKKNVDQEKNPITKGHLSQALKESGYDSDSTLIFRKKEDFSLWNPLDQREAYKTIQKGGDIPIHGLRKLAPEPKRDSEPPLPPPKDPHRITDISQGTPKKYVENQVTIHYKTPVRQEIKEYYSENELIQRQQEAMKEIYQEERRRKYLQELQDMHNRRHTDNFTPSQKSPIALNRYDDFDDLVVPQHKIHARSPEPRLVAKALYNFVGMTPRELTFRKGDNIYVRRQIDKNWYEGELNAMVGLFPVNYVEIIPYDNVRTTPRKPHEGQARAKYNFLAKTHLELSLAKGEMVIITRRVDNNWYEGKIGGRRGIFPASYVDVLIDPQDPPKENPKPIASPAAHSLLLNGSSVRESMGTHTYTPNLANPEQPSATSYFAKPVQINYCNNFGSKTSAEQKPVDQALHIDTQNAEPSPYKALYKYLPQNDDELDLMEGDTVYVLEKCDDGWFVGSNERTGAFGTFPGNYVDKI